MNLHLIEADSTEIITCIRVLIGSKHTLTSHYVLVKTKMEKVIIASNNIWLYYNLNHLLPLPNYTFDLSAYIFQMKRKNLLQLTTQCPA